MSAVVTKKMLNIQEMTTQQITALKRKQKKKVFVLSTMCKYSREYCIYQFILNVLDVCNYFLFEIGVLIV